MTNEEAVINLEMINVAFVKPVTFEQRKLIDDTFKMAIKALSQEPCEDCISRQAVMGLVEHSERLFSYDKPWILKEVKELPSVTQKSGKWIEKEGWDGDIYYECSVCSEPFCLIEGTPTYNLYNYCPNCGAKMESEVNNG